MIIIRRYIRNEYLGSVYLMMVIAILLMGLLWPQLGAYQKFLEGQKLFEGFSGAILDVLPVASPENEGLWRKVIEQPFYDDAKLSGVQILEFTHDWPAALPVKNLPATLRRVPFSLKVSGTFAEIQRFQERLSATRRGLIFKSVSLEAPLVDSGESDVRPVLDSVLQFDLIIRSTQG